MTEEYDVMQLKMMRALQRIAAMADTESQVHREFAEPYLRMGDRPSGWRIVEAMREIAIDCIGSEPLGESGGEQVNAELRELRQQLAAANTELAQWRHVAVALHDTSKLEAKLLHSTHQQIMEDRERHNAAIEKADRQAAEQEQLIETLRAQLANDKSAYRQAVVALRQELAALQSQPRLQPVTPEAMAELEGRDAWVILFRHRESYYSRYERAIYFPLERGWFGSDGNQINPLDWYWYIEPSTIPEVQQ